MTAALVGLGSGALHALSGPDHLLGVAPAALACRRGAWRIGLAWGVGHGVGTAAVAGTLLALSSLVDVSRVERWAERGAGMALVAVGVLALLALRRANLDPGGAAASRVGLAAAVGVGVIHGALGAAALVPLVMGAATPGAPRVAFLAGFSAGGAVAMAALTAWLATMARAPRVRALLPRIPAVAAAASVAVGLAWFAAGT
jgi:hypothetical protein